MIFAAVQFCLSTVSLSQQRQDILDFSCCPLSRVLHVTLANLQKTGFEFHLRSSPTAFSGQSGRFPFGQKFRKFRFGAKWKTFFRFAQLENSQKKWNCSKGSPVFPVGTSHLCSIYRISRLYHQFHAFRGRLSGQASLGSLVFQ